MKSDIRKFMVIAAVLAVGAVCKIDAATEGTEAKILWTHRITGGDDGTYAGWPTVTRMRSGELVIAFSGDREEHMCPWGKVQEVHSVDQGETWSSPRTIANSLIDNRDAGLVEMPDGSRVLFYFTSLAFTGLMDKHPSWRRHYDKIGGDAVGRPLEGSWARVSTDGGRTWSEPKSTIASTPHGAVLLKDGRLLLLGTVTKGWSRTYWAVESVDGGRTWREVVQLDMTGVKPDFSICEPSLFEGLDGTLHGYIRCETGEKHLLYTKSSDGGRSWSKVMVSGIDGFPPHFVRLRNGDVVCSYGRRKPGRGGIFARVSKNDGKSWGEEIEIARSENMDLGYASTAELDDGSLLSAYYFHMNDEPLASLCVTKWSRGHGETSKSVP